MVGDAENKNSFAQIPPFPFQLTQILTYANSDLRNGAVEVDPTSGYPTCPIYFIACTRVRRYFSSRALSQHVVSRHMSSTPLLTKSLYLTGLDNPRQMWYEARHDPPLDEGTRWRMEQGQQVATAARKRFPGGEFVGGPPTTAQLRARRPLFEARFAADGYSARVDVLRPASSGGWVLTEVKSGTMTRRPSRQEALSDAAFQAWVLGQTGIDVSSVEVLHLNPDYVSPNDEPLFTTLDFRGERAKWVNEVEDNAPDLRDALHAPGPPEPGVSRACKKCECPEPCAEIPDQSVFTLPNLYWGHQDDILSEGRIALDEIQGHPHLKARHERYIEAVQSGEPYVNQAAIRDHLDTLEYPIHFFDFEAIDYALPRYEETSPWAKIPFQYSLHLLPEDEAPIHREYLHDGMGDPRPELVDRMLEDVGPRGSIVVYNKTFEKKRLEELQQAIPERHDALQQMIDRLWDQAEIFKNWHYMHPAQKGSWSLKAVLPVFAPRLAYDDLAVQDGMAAVRQYAEMAETNSTPKKRELRDDLLTYCERDTYAMVEIHNRLKELAHG